MTYQRLHLRLRKLVLIACLAGSLPLSIMAAPPSIAWALQEESQTSWIHTGGVPRDVQDLRVLQQHVQQLSEKVIPATVGLRIGPVEGSGVIINKEGYVMTAAHVIGQPDQDVSVILPNGRQVRGRTLGMNRGIDAGLVRILDPAPSSAGWPFAETGNSASLRSGQWCVATGHPGGFQSDRNVVVRLGRLLSNSDSVIISDCTLVGGDSGGPLFDMHGRVIAIHSRIGTPLAANLHVPVDGFRGSWDRMVRKEAWGHLPGFEPFLGVQGRPDADDAEVAYVYPDTPAEQAGLRVGDIILAMDGRSIDSFDQLVEEVGQHMPGDEVTLRVRRGARTLELTLIIGRRDE